MAPGASQFSGGFLGGRDCSLVIAGTLAPCPACPRGARAAREPKPNSALATRPLQKLNEHRARDTGGSALTQAAQRLRDHGMRVFLCPPLGWSIESRC
jgi:hypothetical protein